MTTSKRDLVAEEGVDEGSAASTVEGPGAHGEDVVGLPPHGDPLDPEQHAAPKDVETPDTASVPRTGQTLQLGER